MHAGFYRSLAIFALSALALPALSQTVVSGRTAHRKVKPARLQSFTAEFKESHEQTLANGTTITSESTMVQARDSRGRSMQSTTVPQQYGDYKPTTLVHVEDPVAGYDSYWGSRSRTVKVIKLPPLEKRHGCWQSESGGTRMSFPVLGSSSTAMQSNAFGASSFFAAAGPRNPMPGVEDLGTMKIEGVEARGQRWTTTIPVGLIGNDQPLVSIEENWFADGLGLDFSVRSLRDDPQMGKETRDMVRLDQGEPDPALFQPPEGYEVVTEELVPCKDQASLP